MNSNELALNEYCVLLKIWFEREPIDSIVFLKWFVQYQLILLLNWTYIQYIWSVCLYGQFNIYPFYVLSLKKPLIRGLIIFV